MYLPLLVLRCQNRKPPFLQISSESSLMALFNWVRCSLPACDSDKLEPNPTGRLSKLNTQERLRGWLCPCSGVSIKTNRRYRIEFIQGSSTQQAALQSYPSDRKQHQYSFSCHADCTSSSPSRVLFSRSWQDRGISCSWNTTLDQRGDWSPYWQRGTKRDCDRNCDRGKNQGKQQI